jgi:hypothetical protein
VRVTSGDVLASVIVNPYHISTLLVTFAVCPVFSNVTTTTSPGNTSDASTSVQVLPVQLAVVIALATPFTVTDASAATSAAGEGKVSAILPLAVFAIMAEIRLVQYELKLNPFLLNGIPVLTADIPGMYFPPYPFNCLDRPLSEGNQVYFYRYLIE